MPISMYQVLKHLRYSGVSVPPLYEESFKKAIRTFQYQRVYDPINENIVHLSNIPDDIGDELDFLGPYPSFLMFFFHFKLISFQFVQMSIRSYLKLYLNLGYTHSKRYSTKNSKRGS